MKREINFDVVLRALWLAILATAPSAVLSTILTWRLVWLRYLMMGLHCVFYVAVFIFFLQPHEKQWKILRSITRRPEDVEALNELERRAREEDEREARWK